VEDSTLPDFKGCVREGPVPVILRGCYRDQLDWAINYLRSGQIGADETVAFLHPLGWFRDLKRRLDAGGLAWASIIRASEWPDGPEQIVLSTMHSAKGLEVDHVLAIGYNAPRSSGTAPSRMTRCLTSIGVSSPCRSVAHGSP
jgi:hypothetical protein